MGECNHCKHDGGQKYHGSFCEHCKWNYTLEDCFETNDPASVELFNTLKKIKGER